MKRFLPAVLGAICLLAQTSPVRSIYILPMSGGLDQYLAAKITQDHVMMVVANPKSADAVLTDRLGEEFEQQLEKIHPLEHPVDKDKSKTDSDKATDARPSFHSSSANGTIFLVDARSRQVLWSDYEKPSRSGMDKEAERIAKKLQAFGK